MAVSGFLLTREPTWAEFNNDRTRREFVLSLQVSEGRL